MIESQGGGRDLGRTGNWVGCASEASQVAREEAALKNEKGRRDEGGVGDLPGLERVDRHGEGTEAVQGRGPLLEWGGVLHRGRAGS